MSFTLVSHPVTAVSLGDKTAYAGGRLSVALQDVQRLFKHAALASVRATWASPGDSVRIVKVLDAVEPRTKGPGGGGIFPGFVGPNAPQGRGTTHALSGVAVVTAGYLPRAQEAVIEMGGAARALSVFGELHNLVIEFTPAKDARWEDVDVALRAGSLRLASFLAEAALGDQGLPSPSRSPRASNLPRVGAITNLQTQGTFKDVFVYGKSFGGQAPRQLDPAEVADGAIVSGQFGHPSLKNPTWMHQNHPVVRELQDEDGKTLRFAGLVIAPEPVQAEEKERVAALTAQLCSELGWQGAVITKEGGGNADADISLKMDALAAFGIEAVGLFAELAGPLGTAPGLVVPPEKGTALISTGNYDEMVQLPRVDRALGGDTLDLVSGPAAAACELATAALYCSLSPMGAGRVMCREAA